jgi:hypothetical protein
MVWSQGGSRLVADLRTSGLPVTDEAGRLFTRADISPMTMPPRQVPTLLHHGSANSSAL